MESTGKYWIPIYNILEPTCNIVLAHPKYVKAIKGKKTDKEGSAVGIFLLKSAEVTRKRLLLSPECCLPPFTTSLKKMSLTIPSYIAGRTLPPEHRTVSVEEAIFILQRQGYLVTSATP